MLRPVLRRPLARSVGWRAGFIGVTSPPDPDTSNPATDTHSLGNRAPGLAVGRETAATRIGEEAATDMVLIHPQGALDKSPPNDLPSIRDDAKKPRSGGLLQRFFKGS